MSVGGELVGGVDFVGMPTRDLEAAAAFYGETLGLHRSVWIPERNYSEFETGNLTISVFNAEAMGLEHTAQRQSAGARTSMTSRPRARRSKRGV